MERSMVSQDTVSRRDREDLCARAVNIGLAANTLLAILKTAVGIVGQSPALLADGINSTSDVAYNLVIVGFMRLARKPADAEHPYGHRQMETIAALVVGSFVMTTAVTVFWNAVDDVFRLLSGQNGFEGARFGALIAGLFTVALKIALTVYTQRVGRETSNPAVLALAYDHRNDILSGAAATAGIFMGRAGYLWVDPLAGALVALVILRTGIEIMRDSSADLMDTVPGDSLADRITALVSPIPGVKQIEEIHSHRFGPYLVANITIGVEGSLTVAAGDAIASHIEHTLIENVDYLRRVYVHYHPVRSQRPVDASKPKDDPQILADLNLAADEKPPEPLIVREGE
jgi:cation diffusion facilitator family transporter